MTHRLRPFYSTISNCDLLCSVKFWRTSGGFTPLPWKGQDPHVIAPTAPVFQSAVQSDVITFGDYNTE